MKKTLITLLFLLFLVPVFALAVRIQTYNGSVTERTNDGTITIKVDRGVSYSVSQRYSQYTIKPTSGSYAIGDAVNFSVNEDVTPPVIVAGSLQKGTNPSANVGVGSKSNASTFRLFPDLSCAAGTSLDCFTQRVWSWSTTAILLLSIGAFVIAGIIYMTSAGSPRRIEMAKKIMFGALSAVAVIILGRFFLVNVVGVEWIS